MNNSMEQTKPTKTTLEKRKEQQDKLLDKVVASSSTVTRKRSAPKTANKISFDTINPARLNIDANKKIDPTSAVEREYNNRNRDRIETPSLVIDRKYGRIVDPDEEIRAIAERFGTTDIVEVEKQLKLQEEDDSITKISDINAEDAFDTYQSKVFEKNTAERSMTHGNSHPKNLWNRFKNYLSGKNDAMLDAIHRSERGKHHDPNYAEVSTRQNQDKVTNWFEKFLKEKKNTGHNNEQANKFIEQQHNNAVEYLLRDDDPVDLLFLDKGDGKDLAEDLHWDEKAELAKNLKFHETNKEVAQMRHDETVKEWTDHLKKTPIVPEESTYPESAEDYIPNLPVGGDVSEEPTMDESFHMEDLIGNEDQVEHQENLSVKIDNDLDSSIKKKKRAPRGSIKGFTADR